MDYEIELDAGLASQVERQALLLGLTPAEFIRLLIERAVAPRESRTEQLPEACTGTRTDGGSARCSCCAGAHADHRFVASVELDFPLGCAHV